MLSIDGIDCLPSCGDGVLLETEECDDLNFDNSDGCEQCKVTEGWSCNEIPTKCLFECGDQLLVKYKNGCTQQIMIKVG